MNIYEKINEIKETILTNNLKKSGKNKFANYEYFELADFVPTIIKKCKEIKLTTIFNFNEELAILTIINAEKIEEKETYTSPMKNLEIKGCNAIQALGGVETYQRRYLYMIAFDITENDMFDAEQKATAKRNENMETEEIIDKLVTDKEVEMIKKLLYSKTEELTNKNVAGILKKWNRTKLEELMMTEYVEIIHHIEDLKKKQKENMKGVL